MAHGIGSAKGDEKPLSSERAVASPLLETIHYRSIPRHHQYFEIFPDGCNDAASYVQDLAASNANIIFGAKYDETMTDEATITVIATGLETKPTGNKIMPDLKYQTNINTNRKTDCTERLRQDHR